MIEFIDTCRAPLTLVNTIKRNVLENYETIVLTVVEVAKSPVLHKRWGYSWINSETLTLYTQYKSFNIYLSLELLIEKLTFSRYDRKK